MPEVTVIEKNIIEKTATRSTNAEDIQLNEGQAIQTILGHPPSWILKSGISIVALFVVVLGLMSWLIKYPDVIMADVILTTEHPPIRVIARNSGRLDKWLVEDQSFVEEGSVLAEFFNTARTNDILVLEKFLKRIERTEKVEQIPRTIPSYLQLGELQSSFSTLSESYKDLLYFGNATQITIKIASLENQIQHTGKLIVSQEKQLAIFQKETKLALKDWDRYQYLIKEGGCTQVELEGKELNYLQHQRQAESLQSNITNNELQIEQLRLQIAELKQGQTDGVVTKLVTLKEHGRRLQSEIARWKDNYLIIAPISGQISLSKVKAEQQFVNVNTEILTIVPTDTTNIIIARAMIPTSGAGKVKTGMNAVVSFSNYPSQEFGTVSAEVTNIALIPQQEKESSSYELVLQVPQTLRTSYNKTIAFQQEMQGTAKIITEDKRVLERIMNNLVAMLKE